MITYLAPLRGAPTRVFVIMVLFLSSSAFALFQAPFEEGVRPINLKTQSSPPKADAPQAQKLKSSAQRSNIRSFFPKEVEQDGAVAGIKDIKATKEQADNAFVKMLINTISFVFVVIIVIAGLFMFWPKGNDVKK